MANTLETNIRARQSASALFSSAMAHQQPSQGSVAGGGPANRGPDYVLFDRSLNGFSEETLQRAKAAQLKFEHFYKAAVDLAIERNNRSEQHVLNVGVDHANKPVTPRRIEIERKIQSDETSSDERKNRMLLQHGRKESSFLRLRRTKLGLSDFKTVKVIGKGAFGEVRVSQHRNRLQGGKY
jgi:hypothetical protein